MKKTVLLIVAFCFTVGAFAQKQPKDLVINPMLYEQFGKAQIDQYLQNNFAELFRLNFKMTNYALVTSKMMGENYQLLGFPEQYANKGVTTNENDIIEKGWINPFLYSFPQDDRKFNIFPLHQSGYYIIVAPKYEYDEKVNTQLGQFEY